MNLLNFRTAKAARSCNLKNTPSNVANTTARAAPADFKAEVLKMISNGKNVAYVAQALGISEALIYKWKQRTKAEEKQLLSGNSSHVVIDKQRLQQHIRQLEAERDILKKDGAPLRP